MNNKKAAKNKETLVLFRLFEWPSFLLRVKIVHQKILKATLNQLQTQRKLTFNSIKTNHPITPPKAP